MNKRTTLPCILDGKFFAYSEADSTITKKVGICRICQPKIVKICGFHSSTSNFVTHLKRKHGEDTYKDYRIYLNKVKKFKSSRLSNCSYSETEDSSQREFYENRDVSNAEPSVSHEQFNENSQRTYIHNDISNIPRELKVLQDQFNENIQRSYSDSVNDDEPTEQMMSQEQFNENILNYFVHSMIPLQTIDDPYFKKIFEGFNITAKGLNMINKRTLKRLINDNYIKEMINIKVELRDINEVCTTADIWSSKTQSFLGVMAHWLDSNLKRKSKTLACRRFPGTHSYDEIASLIEEVHAEFGLNPENVLVAISDNSNLMGKFKEFDVDFDSCEYSIKIEPEENYVVGEDSHYERPESTILEIPAYLRCSAYRLNKCVTTDVSEVLENDETTIAQIHKQVVTKCKNLWEAASSPKLAEIIYRFVGHNLSIPDNTRWTSFYDALEQVASVKGESVHLHTALEIPDVLSADDFEYINKYLRCSKPIAEALDILQGDKDMYYGILLPCLVSLRKKLVKLNREPLIFCKNLAKKYLESVEAQFADFFDISSKVAQNAAVAAISYPRFKDKWLSFFNLDHHSRIRSIFKEAVVNEISKTKTIKIKKSYEDSFFEFDSDSSENETTEDNMYQVQQSKADAIISHYLADQERDISILDRFPEIKSVFRKYNTSTPSSGPTERLFSYKTMTNSSKSHRFSDEMFEKRLLLKSNLL